MTLMETASRLQPLRAERLCSAPDHGCEALAELLAQHLGARRLPCSPDLALPGTALLLYRDPVAVLSAAMAAGETPGAALARWRAGASCISRLRRRNRAGARLLEADALCRTDARSRAALGLGETPLPCPDSPPRGALLALLAAEALRRDPAARQLAEELAASALPLPSPPAGAGGPDEAFAALQALMSPPEPAPAGTMAPMGPDPVSAAQIALLEEELGAALQRVALLEARPGPGPDADSLARIAALEEQLARVPLPALPAGDEAGMTRLWIETLEAELELLYAARPAR